MKTILTILAVSLLCGCSGNAGSGQYKTKERPSAVLEPVEPGKDAKDAKGAKAADKK